MPKGDRSHNFVPMNSFQKANFIRKGMCSCLAEKGRSLTEILLVIAIMGILSVLVIWGFRLLMDKRMANAIVYDSRMVHVDAQSRVSVPVDEWQTLPYSFESKKTIQIMRNIKGTDYVKVLGVEQAVCQQVLNMAVVDVVSFLNEDFTPKMLCESENNIIVNWMGLEKEEVEPEPECETASDCGEDFVGICKDEHCVACNAALERPNTAKTECVCDPEKALTCKNEEGDKWCCGEELICGEKKGECKDGEGKCIYTFEQPDTHKKATCSYEMTQPNPVKEANCSYEMTQLNPVRKANCKYTLTNKLVDGNYEVTLSSVQGCSSNQYCYLFYSDEGCSNSLSDSSSGTLYGTCLDRTVSSTECVVAEVEGGLTPKQGCSGDQYCYLYYNDKDCSNSLSDSSSGTLYGTCLDRTVSSTECVVAEVEGGLTPKQGCSGDQYCYLYYNDADCSNSLSDSSSGTFYGTCLDRTVSSTECVIDSVGGGLTQKQGCPFDEYCYLKWAGSDDCSDSISDKDEGELLGACLKRNKNNPECPIK